MDSGPAPAIADNYVIKWGQEFPRVLLAIGNASGNEFEETTIQTERVNPWIVESNCAGTALVRPTSETILASYVMGPVWGGDQISAFLRVRK